MSIATYFTQIKKLWDDYNSFITITLCSCGHECASYKAVTKLIQNQQLLQFLVGLDEHYKGVRGNILMMKPLPDIDEVYSVLLQEENQRGLNSLAKISAESATMNIHHHTSTGSTNECPSWEQNNIGLAAQQRNSGNSGQRFQRKKSFL